MHAPAYTSQQAASQLASSSQLASWPVSQFKPNSKLGRPSGQHIWLCMYDGAHAAGLLPLAEQARSKARARLKAWRAQQRHCLTAHSNWLAFGPDFQAAY